MGKVNKETNGKAAANICLPQWGLTCLYETLVFNGSAVLRLKKTYYEDKA